MFARFDENSAMTLQDIKKTKRYGRTDGRTDARTHRHRENSISATNKVCGGYKQRGPRTDSGSTLFAIEASLTFQQRRKADDYCCD